LFVFDKFIVAGRKSKPCLVFILCIAEFYLEATVFLTINIDSENMYWEYSGGIFNYVNSGQQVSIYTAFIIILIILFGTSKTELL